MAPLVLLAVATFLILLLGVVGYRKTHSVAFLLGMALMYYFTLYGAWHIVFRSLLHINEFGVLEELERHLFTVQLDNDYLLTLALYSAFILAVEVGVIMLWRPVGRVVPSVGGPSFRIFDGRLVAIIVGLLSVSVTIMLPYLSDAWQTGSSGYSVTRFTGSGLFTIHQVTSELALMLTTIAFASCFGDHQNRYLAYNGDKKYRAIYVSLLLCLFVYETILGNRNDLLTAGISGGLFYLQNIRKARIGVILGGVVAVSLILDVVGSTRGIPINQMYRIFSSDSGADLSELMIARANGTESYAAHLSLYGVLAMNVQPSFGVSIVPLVTSIVPRTLWLDRPEDVYVYYASSLGLVDKRGFTIHHATGWYLNFGVCGVVIGGFLLSATWSFCAWTTATGPERASSFGRALGCVALPSFVGHLPSLLRAGFEGYKAVGLETLFLPSLMLGFALVSDDLVLPRRATPKKPLPSASEVKAKS